MNVPSHEITVERDQGSSTVHLRFASDHRLNPLTRGLVTGLLSAVRELRADPPLVVILQGRENFSCGAHRGELADLDAAQLSAFIADELELCRVLAALPSVTIAAIRGVCIGNAAELALSCDLRLACEDASLAWPEVSIGYPAPVQGLARHVGQGVATQLALLGERITARRAHDIGLVCEVVEAGHFDDRLAELAARSSALPRQAVRQTKERLAAAFSGEGGKAARQLGVSGGD